MINRSDESVAADEIEECLRTHSLIHEVSVLVNAVGEQQETIHAIVVARAAATLAELRAFLEQQVAAFKWPARQTLVDSLPLTPMGQVNKQQLAAQLAE